jgi:hypothetical protein
MMSKLNEKITRIKGKVTRPIAQAAGDRHSEAKNAVEANTGKKPEDATLDAAEHATRAKHNDV